MHLARIRWKCARAKQSLRASSFLCAISTRSSVRDASSVLKDGIEAIRSTSATSPSALTFYITTSRPTRRCRGRICATCSVKSCMVATSRTTGIVVCAAHTLKNTWTQPWYAVVTFYIKVFLLISNSCFYELSTLVHTFSSFIFFRFPL